MLFDLQLLNVVIGQGLADYEDAHRSTSRSLHAYGATKGRFGNEEDADHTDGGKEKNDVAVDTVDDGESMSNNRDELKEDKNTCRQDTCQMHHDASSPEAILEVIALARNSTLGALDPVQRRLLGTEITIEIEEDHARQGKNDKPAAKKEPHGKIVALCEADRVVDAAKTGHQGRNLLLRRGVFHGEGHGKDRWEEEMTMVNNGQSV